MRFRAYDWDTDNVDHIARHGIEPWEAEAACRGGLIIRGRQGRYIAYGRTEAGRYLVVILHAQGGGMAHVITAREMNQSERRFYQGRH